MDSGERAMSLEGAEVPSVSETARARTGETVCWPPGLVIAGAALAGDEGAELLAVIAIDNGLGGGGGGALPGIADVWGRFSWWNLGCCAGEARWYSWDWSRRNTARGSCRCSDIIVVVFFGLIKSQRVRREQEEAGEVVVEL